MTTKSAHYDLRGPLGRKHYGYMHTRKPGALGPERAPLLTGYKAGFRSDELKDACYSTRFAQSCRCASTCSSTRLGRSAIRKPLVPCQIQNCTCSMQESKTSLNLKLETLPPGQLRTLHLSQSIFECLSLRTFDSPLRLAAKTPSKTLAKWTRGHSGKYLHGSN